MVRGIRNGRGARERPPRGTSDRRLALVRTEGPRARGCAGSRPGDALGARGLCWLVSVSGRRSKRLRLVSERDGGAELGPTLARLAGRAGGFDAALASSRRAVR